MTSKRTALFVDAALSRLGSALLIVVFPVAALAFAIGLFPCTLCKPACNIDQVRGVTGVQN